MTNKNKILMLSIAFLITIVGIFLIIFTFSLKIKKIEQISYSIAIETSLESNFTPLLTKFKTHINEQNVNITFFETEKELQNILKNAKKNNLLAVLTPMANDIANLETLNQKELLAPIPTKNTELFTYAALQKNVKIDNTLKALVIAYDPYIELTHKEPSTEKTNFAPLLISATTDDLLLANCAWAKNCLQEENIIETLQKAQNKGIIQKNPVSYTLNDIYQIFQTKLTNKIIIPFSFFFDIPKIELENYTMIQTKPFFGTMQTVLFPTYVAKNFENADSIYTKAYDFFANPDFQYEFANAQNYLPARIDSLQRTPYSDAMRTFLLQESTFINTETQYANADEKKELLSIMKEALTTSKTN